MELFGLLWQILVFVIVKIFDKVAYVVDDIMFNLEDYEVYDKVVKSLSLCVGNFYFWQALATIGFYHYLRQLAAKFPPPDSIIATGIGAVDIGPSMQQLVEEKETALKEAASKNEDLDKEINGLRAKVVCLEKEVDFISKDRYALVRDKFILQNKLEDFNSWPEFRVEYDQLVTEFVAMKRQRAREHISQDQVLEIAKEAKLGLAEAKLAIAMSKVAHSEELKQVQQERDQAKESYRTLLAKTTAAAATITSTTTAAVVTPAVATTHTTEVTPGDKALQEEITRLSLAFRSQTSLLTKKSSDLKRMQALLETRSNHSVSELRKAAATILNLEEEKEQADKRIAELERDAQDANAKADEMEGLYMAVAFGDEGEGETDEDEEEKEEDGDEEDGEEGAYEDGNEDDDEDDDEDEEEGGDSNEADEEGDKKTYDENEELFKDMKGSL